MENPFADLDNLLIQGRKAVLARIVRQKGSSPRSIGTKCLILEDGSLKGTIGGGLLEYQVVEKAKEVLKKGASAILHFQLSGEDVAQTQMLCGGLVDVYLEPVVPGNAAARAVFDKIKALIGEGRKGMLLTAVSEGIRQTDGACRLVLEEGGGTTGALGPVLENSQSIIRKWYETGKLGLVTVKPEGPLIFAEPLEPEDVLYLFGAGHVSARVASLAKMVGFRVIVIDDRREFANSSRFPDADECIVLPFSDAFDRIVVNDSSYIAIITRGHIHDKEVLRSALRSAPAYIGMIGSKRKRDLIYGSLSAEGISLEKLQQVHAPIGLDISAQTPEEIAVSIVAELIQVKGASKRDL